MKGAFITNERGKVIEISGNNDNENQNIEVSKKKGVLNQQWDILYVDEMAPEPAKGQLNKDFGMYVQRPFHIVSKMASGRYLDIHGKNLVIRTQNRRLTQQWWFDQKSLTIKSRFNNLSFDIVNSGRSTHV